MTDTPELWGGIECTVNRVGDRYYLVMEYVDGPNLDRLVRDRGPLPIGQACEFIRQAALGLQHAHEQALVHRDIKPANLMVTATAPDQPGALAYRGAVLKVLDMGVARLYQLGGNQEELITTLTQDGAVIGTPDYIAPEQLENAHEADIRQLCLDEMRALRHEPFGIKLDGLDVEGLTRKLRDVPGVERAVIISSSSSLVTPVTPITGPLRSVVLMSRRPLPPRR